MSQARLISADPEAGVFKEKFNALEYIRTYYPDVVDIEKLLVIMYLLHTNAEGDYIIDSIALKTNTERELVENVAIFDFYREVVELLLPVFPLGNASILDVGGGPTIYQHIAVSLLAEHITHAEFLESNRREVLSWLLQEERAHSWDTYFQLVRELFKYGHVPRILEELGANANSGVRQRAIYVQNILNSPDVAPFKHHVQLCVGHDVVHGDIFRSDLGLLGEPKFYDIITSNFVVESAARDLPQWKEGMHNLLSQIKPGGYFVQTAIKNATWYQVGNERLPATAVTKEVITKKCEEEGFEVVYQKVLQGSAVEVVGYDGMVFTLAKNKGPN